MTGPLRWRDGERRDRAALQDFLCTPPARRRRYGRSAPPRDRKWELDAQGHIRDLRPPAHAGELILIGEDDEGIAAVAHAENDGSVANVFIAAIAVALRRRGDHRNGLVGDQLIDELVNRLASRADAAGYSSLTIWGKVDPRNASCEYLCRRMNAQTFDSDGPYDRWLLVVEFAD